MTVGTGLVNADLRRKRSVDLAQRIHERYGAEVTTLRAALLVWPYDEPLREPREARAAVRAVSGVADLVLAAWTEPSDAGPAAGVGIWELSVRCAAGPLPKGEADGWARAVFGYRAAPLVYRRGGAGRGWFRRPAADTSGSYVVFHGEHGPMHPSDVPAATAPGACA
ncbi:hypothetical protein WIS52_01955 [Pseudonocardia nematodicida]|uniref:Uncharacterized protein n=1 Tax=Pseudonocardia nematodicida TaxID=1206997 RepID=A0ABV1K436_9PSEU